MVQARGLHGKPVRLPLLLRVLCLSWGPLSSNSNGNGRRLMYSAAGELARRYEAQGGDYKDTPGSKNKPKKGEPEKKGDDEE